MGFENEWEYCRNAIKYIRKFNLNPNFKNFSVLYLYFSGESKSLNDIITKKIKEKNLTNEECLKLYKKFIEKIDQKELDLIYERLQNLLVEILDKIEHTNSSIKIKNKKFDGYIEKISNHNIPIEEFSNILKSVVEELKDFKKDCDDLSEKLNSGSDEINLLKKKIEELQKKAEIDPLTGIFNRRTFDEKIKEIINDEESQPVSLIFVDIDDFKKVNDTYGHLIGDEVLKYVAKKLKNNSKYKDIVARYGGEEFVMILPNTSLKGAVKFAENLRKLISTPELVLKKSGKKIGKISASFGVSEYRENEPISEFIERADKALYYSKTHGKNQVNSELVLT